MRTLKGLVVVAAAVVAAFAPGHWALAQLPGGTVNTPQPLKPYAYVATANRHPGVVVRVGSTGEMVIFKRPGNAYLTTFNFAKPQPGVKGIAPAYTLYFGVSIDGHSIWRGIGANNEAVVYTDKDYIRAVRVHPDGTVYFSKAQKGGPNAIYRLDANGAATVYATVDPTKVWGWRGSFAFNKAGGLFIADGAGATGKIYEYGPDGPDGPATPFQYYDKPASASGFWGFCFPDDTPWLYFTDHGNRVYKGYPGKQPTVLYQSPNAGDWFTDVQVR